MNVYKLLKLNRVIKNHRIKFLGVYLLHKLNQRYLAVNLDPVMACNLRCKMCYFTDKDYVKKLKGQFNKEDMNLVAQRIFKRAIKLQVGCGTEPTLYKDLVRVVELGKAYKVPYISLTTNANLLTEEEIENLLKAGLNEFTISLHGVTKASYENFMKKASYEKFHNALNAMEKLKATYDFTVRVNYTFNKDNFLELKDFFKHYNSDCIDVLQIRPIRKLGNTEYDNFDVSEIIDYYEPIIKDIGAICKQENITLLAPNSIKTTEMANPSSYIYDYTFCYISPQFFWKDDYNWREESLNTYTKRIGWGKQLLKNVFISESKLRSLTSRLNYDIELN